MRLINKHRLVVLSLMWLQLLVVGCHAQGVSIPSDRCSTVALAKDPWLDAIEERIRTNDGLFRYLVAVYGTPSSCKGGTTGQFEGEYFGSIMFEWANGLIFAVHTEPPESSIVELKINEGFSDKKSLFQEVKSYVQNKGISIDWTTPRILSTTTGRTEEYSSTSAGINAFVKLEYDVHVRLLAVKISLAL